MSRPTALGAYIFAGGFTLGVKKHFRVRAVLEAGPYGVATMRHNQPEIPVTIGVENWKVPDGVDFIYGNPPCAAWSPAGAKLVPGSRNWRTDPRVDCTRTHFNLLCAHKPKVWAWESVPQAFTTGRSFVDELTDRAHQLGYSVTYLIHNAMYLGCAQNRKRFFMICHNVELDVATPKWEITGCGEVLRRMNYRGELSPAAAKLTRYDEILPLVNQGETLRAAWDRHTTKIVRKPNGMIKGRPAFTIKRPRAEAPSGVVMNEMVHPTEHRFMTMQELAALCGFPPDYEFVTDGDMGQISRGVCPPVAEFLARNVARAVRADRPVGSPTARVVDISTPPGTIEAVDFGAIRKEMTMPQAIKKIPLSPTTRHAQTGTYPTPEGGEGSGAFIRRMLAMGQFTPDQIVATVHANYPNAKTTVKDVAWNRNRMKKMEGGGAPATAKLHTTVAKPRASNPAEMLAALRQPTRSKRDNIDHDREYDTTALKRGGSNERGVHRDYAAHFFRWGFAGRFSNRDAEILDVGCGTDQPLMAILNHPRSLVPKRYVGVDFNPEPRKVSHRQWATSHWSFDFTKRYKELPGPFNFITCFEVIEHMRPDAGARLLDGIRWNLAPEGVALLSTPVFDGQAAANHLHEWTIPELERAIIDAGLVVEKRYGTFANYQAIKKVASKEQMAIVNELKEYYSGEVISCFLAPLFPDQSRNNVWKLRRSAKRRAR